jgi:hypothetical protein
MRSIVSGASLPAGRQEKLRNLATKPRQGGAKTLPDWQAIGQAGATMPINYTIRVRWS